MERLTSFELFDKIREEDSGDYDMTLLLKDYSENYDIELLQGLAYDISLYLFIKVDEEECKYTVKDIDNVIEEMKKNKLKIPYVKSVSIESFKNRLEERKKNKSNDYEFKNLSIKEIDELIEKRITLKKKRDSKSAESTMIDMEKLLFPFEFYGVRKFQHKIHKKLNTSLLINNINPVKWEGTSTELTALIKSLKQSKKLNNSLNEKQIVERFERFFRYELKNYDQTKAKIRNRTKSFTPFIDKLKENLEQWIKNRD